MPFTVLYIIFGALFVGAVVGYWVVTRALRDPTAIYRSDTGAGGG